MIGRFWHGLSGLLSKKRKKKKGSLTNVNTDVQRRTMSDCHRLYIPGLCRTGMSILTSAAQCVLWFYGAFLWPNVLGVSAYKKTKKSDRVVLSEWKNRAPICSVIHVIKSYWHVVLMQVILPAIHTRCAHLGRSPRNWVVCWGKSSTLWKTHLFLFFFFSLLIINWGNWCSFVCTPVVIKQMVHFAHQRCEYG